MLAYTEVVIAMTDTRIGIIGCSESKYPPEEWGKADPSASEGDTVETLELQHLYSSGFWTVKSRFGRKACDEWRILSGKFGLVDPEMEVSDDYERTLHNMSDEEVAEWVEKVRSQFEGLAAEHPDATLEIVLGSVYREAIADIIDELGFTTNNPVEGAPGNGVQMQMLNERVEEAQNTALNQF